MDKANEKKDKPRQRYKKLVQLSQSPYLDKELKKDIVELIGSMESENKDLK